MLQGFDDHAVGMKLAEVLCQILRAHETRTEEALSRCPAGGDGDAEALRLRQEFRATCIVRGVDHAARKARAGQHECAFQRWASRASALAPLSRSIRTLAVRPYWAASMSGVRPSLSLASMSDPLARSASISLSLPFLAASRMIHRHVGRQRGESGERSCRIVSRAAGTTQSEMPLATSETSMDRPLPAG